MYVYIYIYLYIYFNDTILKNFQPRNLSLAVLLVTLFDNVTVYKFGLESECNTCGFL